MSEQIVTRKCYSCKEIKDISKFSTSKRNPLGKSYRCKGCTRIYSKSKSAKAAMKRYRCSVKGKAAAKRAESKDSRKEYLRNFRKSDKNKACQKTYNAKNRYPIRKKARMAIKSAVRSGKLLPANSALCSCGNQAIHYHHYKGYAKKHWLDVVALCRICHIKQHGSPLNMACRKL